MKIEEARQIVKAQLGAKYTDNHCFEVYDNRDAAFDGIRDRNENHVCGGGCGRTLNTAKFMCRPLDYSNTEGHYIVVKRDKSGYCMECAPRFMKR